MQIYTLLNPGKYHPIHSEDYVFHYAPNQRWLVAAVMDGCSSGHESYFASTLYAKSLNKTCALLSDDNPPHPLPPHNIEQMVNLILRHLFEDIQKIKKQLSLDLTELLSTILLMVLDRQQKDALVVVSGDGIVACHGQLEIIDQNNVPDYLAYHLDQNFEYWYKNHVKSMKYEAVTDISVSTDGLQKLVKDPAEINIKDETLHDFLTKPLRWSNPHALEQLYHHKLQDGYHTYDDLGVVRVLSRE